MAGNWNLPTTFLGTSISWTMIVRSGDIGINPTDDNNYIKMTVGTDDDLVKLPPIFSVLNSLTIISISPDISSTNSSMFIPSMRM